MATIETLTNAIYHEKQQPGEMLCAQHALNAVLRAYVLLMHRERVLLTTRDLHRRELCELLQSCPRPTLICASSPRRTYRRSRSNWMTKSWSTTPNVALPVRTWMTQGSSLSKS
jgi:hypothetical protein